MQPEVRFFDVPVTSDPAERRTKDGSSYLKFQVEVPKGRGGKPGQAVIWCFDDSPSFKAMKAEGIRKGMSLDMTCSMSVKNAPAIDTGIWRGMVETLRKVHIQDKKVAEFLSSGVPSALSETKTLFSLREFKVKRRENPLAEEIRNLTPAQMRAALPKEPLKIRECWRQERR